MIESLMFSNIASYPVLAVVIPAYCVEKNIAGVITSIPAHTQHIIVVDDASLDNISEIIQSQIETDPRLILIRHSQNLGVEGAMIIGFKKALEFGVEIVIKLDGDGQTDLGQFPALVEPLISGKANYMKGNRFRDFAALQKVPIIRHLGNIAHGFLSKLATRYWNIFDPTNGYIAIQAGTLKQLPLENIDKTNYFETSMPAELYPPGAFVLDVPTPARYNDQPSNLRIHRILFEFPSRLLVTLLKRILLKYFLYDFSMAFIYIVIGVPLFLFGMIIGTIKWIHYASLGIQKPTGTIILPMLCVVLGIQFLISAVQIDLQSSPSALLSKPANLDV